LDELAWPKFPDWRQRLETSPLANPIAVHLFLYNDTEILYVLRGRVGQASNRWNSTVNGVMEFGNEEPDIRGRHPDIGMTAKREAKYEVKIDLDEENIRWIGLGATHGRCEPFVVGVYKIGLTKGEFAAQAASSKERAELANIKDGLISSFVQGTITKEVRGISHKFHLETKDISVFLLGTQSVPVGLGFAFPDRKLRNIIWDKIIHKQEKNFYSRSQWEWTSSGAVSLLLCLAYIVPEEKMKRVLSEIKREIEKAR
jgi:hypothetical protein